MVKRIVTPRPRPRWSCSFLSYLILPALLFLLLLLGILVRSFPGPGDVEIVELGGDEPVHVGVDRLHKVDGGGWGSTRPVAGGGRRRTPPPPSPTRPRPWT